MVQVNKINRLVRETNAVAYAELEVSDAVADDIITSNDVSAARAEIKDIEGLYKSASENHIKFVTLVRKN